MTHDAHTWNKHALWLITTHTHFLWCNLSLVMNFRRRLLRRSASAGQPTHSSLSVCFSLPPLLFSLFPSVFQTLVFLTFPPRGYTRKRGEGKWRKSVVPFPTCLKNWKQWRSLICHLLHRVHPASDKPALRFEYESIVLLERSRRAGDTPARGKPDNWTLSGVEISSGYLRLYLKKNPRTVTKKHISSGSCHVRRLKVDLLRRRNEPAGHVPHPRRRRWYHTTLSWLFRRGLICKLPHGFSTAGPAFRLPTATLSFSSLLFKEPVFPLIHTLLHPSPFILC